MSLRLSVAAWALVMCLGGPSPAYAAAWDRWWDYLDQLSGPGPFHGGPTLATTFGCVKEGKFVWVSAVPASDTFRFEPCWYFDWRQLSAEPSARFGHVDADLVETGLSVEWRFLELGAGVGVARFTTAAGDTTHSVNNFTLTPVRLVFKPLRIFSRSPRLGFLQVIGRDTIRFGRLTAADFVAPASAWPEGTGTEQLLGVSLVIDVLQAFRPR